jgi:hypothetical protein
VQTEKRRLALCASRRRQLDLWLVGWGTLFFATFASISMASRNVLRLPSKMTQFSSDHPRSCEMVLMAISNLKEGGG